MEKYKCAICEKEDKLNRSNNPEPLLEYDERVCTECNHFVTATRIFQITKAGHSHSKKQFMQDLVSILKLAFSLREAHQASMALFQEEEE
tara:strand:- start:312 stop:581 length:270 start_codon:yes stop_codon:yes gene_type:complete